MSPATPRRPRPTRSGWQQMLLANPTLAGWAIFMLLMLAGTVKLVMDLPTPQERVVRQFFGAIREGDYPRAVGHLEQGSFASLADQSVIRGVPGGTISLTAAIADELTIQQQLPQARLVLSEFRFDHLRMQRDRTPHRKIVNFEVAFSVTPGGRYPLGAAPPNALHFVLDGHADVVRQGDVWLIHALDFRIVPQPGTSAQELLRLMQGMTGSLEGL